MFHAKNAEIKLVAEQIEKAYQLSSLTNYSFKDRILIHAADWTFYLLIRIIGGTVRFRTEGWEHVEAIEKQGRKPIFAVWHDRIFLGTYYLRNRGIVVITSQSLDGEYIARFLKRFGFGTVRGSSTRGGVGALVEMIRGMKRGLTMAVTVDGPRGPRQVAKDGAVLLAKKTGNPIVPFTVNAEKFWRLGSWDRLQIPKPFTKAEFVVGEPIYVSASDEIEAKRVELQERLDRLAGRAEART